MKLMRTTSILAGLLLAVASFSSAACKKKEDDKKKTTKPAGKKKTPAADKKKGTADTAKKAVADGDKKKAADPKPTPVAAAGDGYAIKFSREMKVGFRYKLVSNGKREQKVQANGKPAPGSGGLSWAYEAEVTVKGVDAKGRVNAEDHKIVKFEVTAGGAKKSPIEKDKVVVATVKDGKEVFMIDGKEASKEAADLMGEVADLQTDDGANEDELFGTKDKKKVGDSWDVNAALLVKDFGSKLKDASLPLKVENTSGKVTLVSASEMGGEKGLNFKVEMKMKNVAPKMGPIKATKGNIDVSMEGWLSVDPTSMKTMKLTRKMVMHVEGSAGPAQVVVDVTQSATETKTAIK